MGFRVGPFVLSKNGCWRRRRRNTNFGPKKFFPPIISPPHLSSQNDQRDVGIILSHRCWVDPPPPPPARQVGHPRPEPPLPSRRPRRGGGWDLFLQLFDPFRPQPPSNRRHTTAGKRPVQAGSPGLSTPSKTKRGRGVSGAGMAGRAPAQEQRRPAAARGLFALGFTRTAAATAHRDVEQGGAPNPWTIAP